MIEPRDLSRAVATHGRVVRVVVAEVQGSAPREAGAAMIVWADAACDGGQSGTIGGGALEWEAAARARAMLAAPGRPDRVDRLPLGPSLGQCCGGAVVLVSELWDAGRLADLSGDLVARSPEGRAMPLAVKRLLDRARARGEAPGAAVWMQGWLVEPVAAPARQIWVWGAGHVGRAIVATLAPLPGLAITWVDVAPDRFPSALPPGVTPRPAPDAAALVTDAPPEAEHLILTFSHALDLELCHRLLRHGFRGAGLIGSATKWARFRSRLAALGHPADRIARIRCPIGDPRLGKHPQAIAIGVAADLLRDAPLSLREEIAG